MSAQGDKILVASTEGLQFSTNSGATFTSLTVTAGAQPAFGDVAMASDGSVMYGIETVEYLNDAVAMYRSTNSGVTWEVVTSAGYHRWSSIDVSASGAEVLAVVSYEVPDADANPGFQGPAVGALLSTTSATTFAEAPGVAETFSFQLATGGLSGNGQAMVVASYNTPPMASFDGGVTWADSLGGERGWLRFALSGDGSRMYAAVENGGVWLRANPPAISSLSPTSLNPAGSDVLTITGANFIHVTDVSVGEESLPFTLVSPTQLVVTTSAMSQGATSVSVITRFGEASLTVAVTTPTTSDSSESTESTASSTTAPADTASVPQPTTTIAPNGPSTVVSRTAPAVAPPSAAAIAATAPTPLDMLPSTLLVGESYEVTVTGFTPDVWVYVYVASEPMLVATAQADATGTLRVSFQVPSLTGEHSLVFYEPASGVIRRTLISIEAGRLPTTGSSGDAPAIAGLLLAIGAAIVISRVQVRRV
jgi:LPXTG-motif cell wall-anchored protein